MWHWRDAVYQAENVHAIGVCVVLNDGKVRIKHETSAYREYHSQWT
jgi:hypothetical protein